MPLKKGLAARPPPAVASDFLRAAAAAAVAPEEDADEGEGEGDGDDDEQSGGGEAAAAVRVVVVAAHTARSSRCATKGWLRRSPAEGRWRWSRMQASDTKLPKRSLKMALGGRGTSPSCTDTHTDT